MLIYYDNYHHKYWKFVSTIIEISNPDFVVWFLLHSRFFFCKMVQLINIFSLVQLHVLEKLIQFANQFNFFKKNGKRLEL